MKIAKLNINHFTLIYNHYTLVVENMLDDLGLKVAYKTKHNLRNLLENPKIKLRLSKSAE